MLEKQPMKAGEIMGRTILCKSCKSTFDEDVLKMKNSENVCLVCGASLSENDGVSSYHNMPSLVGGSGRCTVGEV